MRSIALGICTLMLGAAFIATTAAAAEPFADTLERHLAAIQNRDLEGLLATVSESPGPTLIFPNGQLLTGKQAFREIHTQWFADTQWRMDISEVRRVVGDEMATVLLRYTLRDVPEPGQGNPRDAFLVLVFKLIDGHWLLVHDQNTRIQSPAAD